ncbi:MAG: hypothetical protein ACLS4S_17495, partial [Bacteroides nordii]
MTMRTNSFLFLVVLLGIIPVNNTQASDSVLKNVVLYSPYTKIMVSPGESIDYSIDLINNGDEITNENISLSGLPSN